MKTKLLIAGLALAVLAIPATAPASQPSDVRVGDLVTPDFVTPVVAVPDPALLRVLLVNPKRSAELSIELPSGFTTLDWIDADPFAI